MPRNSYSSGSGSSNPNLYDSNEYPYVASNVSVNRDTTYNRAGYNGHTYSNINRRNSGYHSDLLILINLVSNVDIWTTKIRKHATEKSFHVIWKSSGNR